MAELLREEDWRVLVHRIKAGKCTPFLGAGVCFGVLPLGAEIARKWAQEYGYPMRDSDNLISVAQFLAVKYDALYPKDLLVSMFEKVTPPDFRDPDEPHSALAKLPLPVYITTNYDDFMTRALSSNYRAAKRVLCQWNPQVRKHVEANPTIFEKEPGFIPSIPNPVVFHLHGHAPLSESLVLTEDDYMDFLVNISSDSLLPREIERALTGTSLLFIGYRIADWNFRVLLKSLRSLSRLNVAVMPWHSESAVTREEAQEYLTKYYQNIDVRVYWGTVQEFIKDLREKQAMYSIGG